MAWSTSELASLAATTVNSVRHYHRRGLLDHPDRDTNGYKRYGVPHLVRLLQIRRLRAVGVPITQIARVGPDVATPPQVLLEIDARLAETIERSARARADIQTMLQHGSASGVPAGFEDIANLMSEPDRSLVLIFSQLYDPAAMADVREMVAAQADDTATREFDRLPVDADESTKDRLALDISASMATSMYNFPWLKAPQPHLLKDERTTARTWLESVLALYNTAQVEVLVQAGRLAVEQVKACPELGSVVDVEPG